MPKKKKDGPKTEKRWVKWSDLEAGVNLKAGHPVILLLGDHKGGPGTTTTSSGDLPSGGSTTAAPDASTTSGGDVTPSGGPTSSTTLPLPTAPSTTTTASPGGNTTEPPEGGTTATPGSTTTYSPPNDSTVAPPTTTTYAPPNDSTVAPSTTTTQVPTGTTHLPTTSTTHPPSTTSHPPSTTSHAPKGKRYKLNADHFDNAKAFPKPEQAAFDTYKAVVQTASSASADNLQILVLGHTDTKASDSYNAKLSKERATNVMAYLLQQEQVWLPFYDNTVTTDPQKLWGTLEDQYMLSAIPGSYWSADGCDGQLSDDFTAALKKFQGDSGCDADGVAGPETRTALIKAYMAIEGTSLADGTHVEINGCSFQNQAEDPPTGPNVDSATNRRTEIYVFFGAIDPPVSKWSGDKAGTYAAWIANTDDDSVPA